MVEEDAKARARETLSGLSMRRGWHHIIVRFGPNTTKDFMERSEPGVVLGATTSSSWASARCTGVAKGTPGTPSWSAPIPSTTGPKKEDRTIWNKVRADGSPTGPPVTNSTTRDRDHRGLGWKLNLDLSGHRLSDYPHSAHYDGSLADVDFRPSPNVWVLEIAIAHPHRPIGAFYEETCYSEVQAFPGTFFFFLFKTRRAQPPVVLHPWGGPIHKEKDAVTDGSENRHPPLKIQKAVGLRPNVSASRRCWPSRWR